MTLERFVNEVGPLAETYPLFNPDTIRTSSELTTELRTKKELRIAGFRDGVYTANVSLYEFDEKDGAILYFGQRNGFNAVIGHNIDEATRQLNLYENYWPAQEVVEAVKSFGSTLKVRISELELKVEQGSEDSYFEIDTTNYDAALNQAQRKLAEKVFGEGTAFVKNMEMFSDAGFKTTKIYVLNEDYVENNAQDGPIARAGNFYYSDNESAFFANTIHIEYNVSLRGILKVVADINAPNIGSVSDAYNTLLTHPEEAVRLMTPEIATGLSALVTSYSRQKQ